MDQFKTHRLALLSLASALFIAGLVLNITSYQALFQVTLDVVPQMQKDIGSDALTIFMNIVSNLFNPVVCAGYIIIIYVVTCRKLEILVFLIWFVFLSFILSLLKQVLQYFLHNPDNQDLTGFPMTYRCSSGLAILSMGVPVGTLC
jgi:hypothetical protein